MQNGRLFESTNPLEERLGKAFFDDLPSCPGIYRMYGREELLLYVGKAKNLRRRLFTYRRISADNGSRKTRHLVRMIRNIQIERLPTEQEALLRENKLIRTHKPPFNRAKKAPETYYFISAVPDAGELVFDLRMHNRGTDTAYTFGAFKGHRGVRTALGALLRQLVIMDRGIESPFHLPSQLLNRLTPMHYRILLSECLNDIVHDFLGGYSDRLLYLIIEHSRSKNILGKFIGKLVLNDMEALRLFYDRCSRRNREIIQHLELESDLIPQDKLDDYLVQLSFMVRRYR